GPRVCAVVCSSSGHPYGCRGAPDGEAGEEVEQGHGDDGGAYRASHGHADARGAAAGAEAVVAVRHDHHDAEQQHLAEGPEHVLRWEEQFEVVVVGAFGLAVEPHGDLP